jgi:hypothetical protein
MSYTIENVLKQEVIRGCSVMFHNHMKSLEKHPKKIHITSGAIKIMVPDWFLLDISPQNDNNSFELEGGEHVKTSLNAQSVFYNNFLSASMNYRTPSIK